ncbi:hypothetical protein T01_2977 [Trichinella spiralis]|uniref:Uncharacterized protein n=1 Tax=Trichinella spiralis TaxID=6334 RepID=A0A0V1ASY8_TRISP|nr:hypothetical protein T01_2977 [Trichinella spiralis]
MGKKSESVHFLNTVHFAFVNGHHSALKAAIPHPFPPRPLFFVYFLIRKLFEREVKLGVKIVERIIEREEKKEFNREYIHSNIDEVERKKRPTLFNGMKNSIMLVLDRSWTKFVQRHPRQNGTRFIGQAIQRLSASVELGTKIALGSDGQVVQTIGQELGLSLLDGLLRRSKEQMALTALKRQIEIYEKVDPQSAKLLKNVPTETMVGIIVDSQENQSVPATGNPFLNILAKNGIVVNGQASKTANDSQQGFPVAEVVQGLVRNFIQTVKPSVMTDPIAGSFFSGPSAGGDSNFPFSVVGLPQRPAGAGPASGPLSFLPLLGGGGLQESNSGGVTAPPPDPFAGISDLDNDPSAQIQLEGEADGEPVDNATTTTTTTTTTTAAAPTPTRTTAPTPQAFKQAIQEHVTPSSTTVGTTATRRPIGSRLNELNRRVNRLTTDRPYNYRIQNGNAIRSNRLQPSVTIRPVNVIRPESKAGPVDEQSVPIDPAMPSVHSMMLMNTWQSLSENEKKNPTKPSPAEAYFGRFSPGPVKFETTETKSHSALKATTNVSKYRQRSMNVQLPGGRTASLGDHGLSGADLRGSLTVPKNWLAGHKLGGQMETGHFNDASAFFDFFTSAEDYTWP